VHVVVLFLKLYCFFLCVCVAVAYTVQLQPFVKSLLFFCCINQGIFGAMIVINSFPGERVLILRERAAGTYNASSYFVAKSLAEAIAQIINPIIFSCIVYWLTGLQQVAIKFFGFMLFMILCNSAAVSLAVAISAIGRTTDMAVTVLPMALEICRLLGGFFLPPSQLPGYFSWLDALSYVKYAYVAVANIELTGLVYNCTPAELVTVNGTKKCPTTSGNQTIDSLGLGYLSIGGCAGVLIGYIIAFRIFAYLGIRFITW